MVRDVVSDTLGIADSGIENDRPLGALGMDSLMAIRIRRRCERMFDVTLPATAVFSYPSVGQLSAFLFDTLALHADVTSVSDGAARAALSDMVPLTTVSDDDAMAALRSRRAPRRSTT
jgi:acyl carrier protein